MENNWKPQLARLRANLARSKLNPSQRAALLALDEGAASCFENLENDTPQEDFLLHIQEILKLLERFSRLPSVSAHDKDGDPRPVSVKEPSYNRSPWMRADGSRWEWPDE